MALINNPTKSYLYNFIIKEKNLLITKEHKLPSQQLFTNIQKNFPNTNYFAEEELNYAGSTDQVTFEIRKVPTTIEITNTEKLNRIYLE